MVAPGQLFPGKCLPVFGARVMNVVMKAFTINAENNITAFSSKAEAAHEAREGVAVFCSEGELDQLAATWPGSRLVEIWNTLPGVSPVKKFTDRKTAAARIWRSIQTLEPRPPVQAEAPRAKVRTGSKTSAVIAMLQRPDGATVPEIMLYASHCTSLA